MKKTFAVSIVAAVAVLGLAGCNDKKDDASSSTPTDTSTTAAASSTPTATADSGSSSGGDYADGAALAAKLSSTGCSYTPLPTKEAFAETSGFCNVNSVAVQIRTFASHDTEEQWRKFSPKQYKVLHGDKWTIIATGNTQDATLATVKGLVGGSID